MTSSDSSVLFLELEAMSLLFLVVALVLLWKDKPLLALAFANGAWVPWIMAMLLPFIDQ